MTPTYLFLLGGLLLLSQHVQGSPWEMVFRICSDVSGDPTQMWLDPELGQVDPLHVNDSCVKHQKSYLVNHWEDLVVTEARVSVHADGREVAWITFNAECSETTDWYTVDNIKDSSYNDINDPSVTNRIMSFYEMDGVNYRSLFDAVVDDGTSCYLNRTGWLTVAMRATSDCTWYADGNPRIYYSSGEDRATSLTDSVADSLAVWIRYKNVDGPQKNLALHAPRQAAAVLVDGFTTETHDPVKCQCQSNLFEVVELPESVVVGAVLVNQVSVEESSCTAATNATLPAIRVGVTSTEPATAIAVTASDECTLTYQAAGAVTAYCRVTRASSYVTVWSDVPDMVSVCEIEVFPAMKQWTLTTQDWGHNDTDYAGYDVYDVDLAENVTIIPNPDRPIMERSLVVGWSINASLEHYRTEGQATVHCQVWREGSMDDKLQLVNSTELLVTSDGQVTLQLPREDWMPVEKGDLVGLAIQGKGVVVFRDTGNDTNCVYVKVERGVETDVGLDREFTAVWMDDWLYDVEAHLIPYQAAETPWMKIYHNDTQPHCFTAFLELVPCDYDDPADPHTGIRWKLDTSGHLINQQTFACLDVDIINNDYLPGSASCYNVAWGVWSLDFDSNGEFRIYNQLLHMCMLYNDQCGVNGITNFYLQACDPTLPLVEENRMFREDTVLRGAESWGCYSSHGTAWTFEPDLVTEWLEPPVDGAIPDLIQDCLRVCEPHSTQYSGISRIQNQCLCTDLPQVYLSLPDSSCDRDCFDTVTAAKCGPSLNSADISARSVYSRAQRCLLQEDDILRTNSSLCVEVGVAPDATCPVYCGEGYNLTAGLLADPYTDMYNLTCRNNLTWSLDRLQICEKIRCPMPVAEGVTHVGDPDMRYQDTETFTCMLGYMYFSGNDTRVCQADQTWSGEPYNCTAVFCEGPTPQSPARNDTYTIPAGASSTLPAGDYFYGTELTFICNLGYVMDTGDLQVVSTCTIYGNWSQAEPTCNIVDCGVPLGGTNANETHTDTIYGSMANYTCQFGYEYSAGDTSRECKEDGQWSGVALQCTEILCGHPALINHTELTTTTTSVDAYAEYRCESGYRDPNQTVFRRQCHVNGTWLDLGSPIACQKKGCSDPPNITNTVKIHGGNNVGDTTAYVAEVGYEITVGQLIVTCTEDEQWLVANSNDTIYDVQSSVNATPVDCDVPPGLTDANRFYTTTTFGSNAVYNCSNGANVVTVTSTCQSSGTWTDVTLDCQLSCATPTLTEPDLDQLGPGVSLVVSAGQKTSVGSTVDLQCEPNYAFVDGQPFATCTDANYHWTMTDMLKCTEITCSKSPEHVTTSCDAGSGSTIGTVVTCACRASHMYLSGNYSRTCQNTGDWSGDDLVCTPVACPSDLGQHDQLVITMDNGTDIGARVQFLCLSGYVLVGAKESVCLSNGSWDQPVPFCQDEVSWTIENGKKPGGGGNNDNTTGGGSDEPYYGGCDPPPEVKNSETIVNVSNGIYFVNYTCHPGYKTSSDSKSKLDCKLFQWVGPEFECIETVSCQLPPPGVQSVLQSDADDTLTPGTVVTYKCADNHVPVAGDITRTCQTTGNWSGQPLDCEMRNCTEPPMFPNTTFVYDRYSRGRVVHYYCYPNNILVSGKLTKNCTSDLLWTGDDPVCKYDPEELSDKSILDKLEEELEANLTDRERYLMRMGFKESDFSQTSQGIGGAEVVLFVILFGLLFALDVPAYRQEWKRLKRNLCGEQSSPEAEADDGPVSSGDTVQML